jgi:alpha-tubulin suppressor-like RCC1 family protein
MARAASLATFSLLTLSFTSASLAAAQETPVVTNVQANAGSPSGGTKVLITGTNLTGATEVKFGSAAERNCNASSEPCFTENSPTSILATSPAGSGTVDVRVTAGGSTSEAVAADHFNYRQALKTLLWGEHSSEFGGNATNIPSPVPQLEGQEVTALSGGSGFVFALLESSGLDGIGPGYVYNELGACRGENDHVFVHVCVSEVVGAVAGEHYGLAVLKNGTVWAWGEDTYGQLGPNGTFGNEEPIQVTGIEHAVAVASTFFGGTAVLEDGTVMQWGAYRGKEGVLHTSTPRHVCMVVEPEEAPCKEANYLRGVMAIAAGGEQSGDRYALLRDGHVMAWGENPEGELGDGNTTPSPVPVEVEGLSDATGIAAGYCSGIALLSNGTVEDWGANATDGNPNADQLGDGKTGEQQPYSATPVPVAGLSEKVSAIGSGSNSYGAIAALDNGSVKAWGNPGGTGHKYEATSVPGLAGVTAVAGGFNFGIAAEGPPVVTNVQTNAGSPSGGTKVMITGTNLASATEVKFGSAAASHYEVLSPTSILATSPAGSGTVDVRVTAEGSTSEAVSADHFNYRQALKTLAWGTESGSIGGSGTNKPGAIAGLEGQEVTALASSYEFGFELLGSGKLDAIGVDSWDELGTCRGETHVGVVPVCLSEVVGVAAGEHYGLAVRKNGTVWAWGEDYGDQLGPNGTVGNEEPVQVTGIEHAVAVAATFMGATALLEDGTVMQWGAIRSAEGEHDISTPTHVCKVEESPCKEANYLREVVAIAAGGAGQRYALLRNGHVVAWGNNNNGALGDGNTTPSAVPVEVVGLSEVTAVAAAYEAGVALLSNGTVKDWGGNTENELGSGKTEAQQTNSLTPETVPGVSEVSAIASGAFAYGALALLDNGTVMGWGQPGGTGHKYEAHAVPELAGVTALANGFRIGIAAEE